MSAKERGFPSEPPQPGPSRLARRVMALPNLNELARTRKIRIPGLKANRWLKAGPYKNTYGHIADSERCIILLNTCGVTTGAPSFTIELCEFRLELVDDIDGVHEFGFGVMQHAMLKYRYTTTKIKPWSSSGQYHASSRRHLVLRRIKENHLELLLPWEAMKFPAAQWEGDGPVVWYDLDLAIARPHRAGFAGFRKYRLAKSMEGWQFLDEQMAGWHCEMVKGMVGSGSVERTDLGSNTDTDLSDETDSDIKVSDLQMVTMDENWKIWIN